jgi:hypothetical protein
MRLFVALSVLTVSAVSFAGSIHNADPREYRLRIKTTSGEASLPLNHSTTLEKTCAAFPCTVEVTDLGEKVQLTSGDDSIEIKDGKVMLAGAESGGGVVVESAPAPVATHTPAPAPAPKSKKHH